MPPDGGATSSAHPRDRRSRHSLIRGLDAGYARLLLVRYQVQQAIRSLLDTPHLSDLTVDHQFQGFLRAIAQLLLKHWSLAKIPVNHEHEATTETVG